MPRQINDTSLMSLNPRAWVRIRKLVMMRDHYECQIRMPGCLLRATQIDHRIPRADDGSDDLENLQAACAVCNRKKGGASFFRNEHPSGQQYV